MSWGQEGPAEVGCTLLFLEALLLEPQDEESVSRKEGDGLPPASVSSSQLKTES